MATSLIWSGIRGYSELNSALLEEVFKQVSAGWHFTLDWDLGQVLGRQRFQVFESLEHISTEAAKAAAYARSAQARQSDKDCVFFETRRWLQAFAEPPLSPGDARNFTAMGELLFWLGHLQIESGLRQAITGELIDSAVDKLPIYSLGVFVRGLRTCNAEAYDVWLDAHRDVFFAQIRREADVAHLDESDEAVIAHFLIDLDRQSTVLRTRGDASGEVEATIHDLTIDRVELLANLCPGKQRYGAVGYGHRVSLIALPWDDAEKPGVLAENLLAPWSPRLNALARGFAERRFRPDSWTEYFLSLQSMREQVLAALSDLRHSTQSLTESPPTRASILLQDPTGWDECRRKLNSYPLLPKAAVDEWGFISESSTAELTNSRSKRYAGLRRFSPVREAVSEYARTVGNFLSQALQGLILLPRLRTAESEAEREKLLSVAAKNGLYEQSIRLSIINGFDMCAAVDKLQKAPQAAFANSELPGEASSFCEHEQREFHSTIVAWCRFVDGDHRVQAHGRGGKNSGRQKRRTRRAGGIDDLLGNTRNRLKNSLQSLRKDGVCARVLSETEPWKDRRRPLDFV